MKQISKIKFRHFIKWIVFLLSGLWLNLVTCPYVFSETWIDSVEVEETHLPVIIGRSENPVLKIKVYKNNHLQSSIEQIFLTIPDDTSSKYVDLLEVFFTANNSEFSSEQLFGKAIKSEKQNVISGHQPLERGVNYFWVTVTLSEKTDLLANIKLDCDKISDSQNNHLTPLPHAVKGNRPAVGFHGDSAVYNHRIYFKNPGLITTNKGTLVAVFDMRHYKPLDSQADIDIGMSRSTDGGRTWEPVREVMDMGKAGGLPEDQNGLTDPSILLDKSNNTIWIAALWAQGFDKQRIWTESRPGMSPEETGQLVLVKSEDDGQTWSSPINITSQIKDPSWHLLLQGPGKGITLKDGTLVFPAQFKDAEEMPHSTIIYSRDHGETWHIGTGAKPNTTESQVVELQNGLLMLNLRDNRGGSRSVYITNDMGKTWEEHPTSRKALPEPICQASLINFLYDYKGIKKELLLFSNPNTTVRDRRNITLKVSVDDGKTWPQKYYTLLDAVVGAGYDRREFPMGYSCITQINGHTAGIMYGSSRSDLVFQKVDIAEVLGNE